MSMLMTILHFVGTSAASGITWDAMKKLPNLVKSLSAKLGNQIEEKVVEKLIERMQEPGSQEKEAVFDEAYQIGKELGINLKKEEFATALTEWMKELMAQVELQNSSINVTGNDIHDNGKMFVAQTMTFGDIN